MQRQMVQFVAQERFMEMAAMLDAFKFVPKGRMQWLQRLAWRFLNRQGAMEQAYEPKVTVTRHLVDDSDFIRRLEKQQRNLLQEFNREGRRLLIGSEDYAELMGSLEVQRHHFMFPAEACRGDSILGLKVEVIPWMRGMLVMP